MHVADLALNDFRSYGEAVVHFEPGVSALVGANGSGKTNIVEAIGFLATLGSHRAAGDAALVRAGASRAIVRARVAKPGRTVALDVEITPGKANRAWVNKAPARRPRDILGVVRAVVFAPEDLSLVKGDPEGRRRFLDDLAVQRSPRFAAVKADYERVARQRNSLLKSV
ncbi:MAG: DNA replication and repair protein RecF, partial [Bifidobacteriaceae bacterium]|nr:DNA replication and repair protein RecF [Bifidobacteriaceae bacterium]